MIDAVMPSDGASGAMAHPCDHAAPDGAVIELEQRLFALESVHDCKVIPRSIAGGRMALYVVPAESVRPDRMEQWVAAIQAESALCDVIAVSRLPLTDDGAIDAAALARLPLLDDQLLRRLEDWVKAKEGVRDAVIVVEAEQEQLPPVHCSELFSEQNESGDGEVQFAEQRAPAPANESVERRLAISHGGELERAEQLPRSLGESLERAAREHPDHGLRTIGVDGSEQFLSYPELLASADRILGGLRRAGLRAGDRVLFQFIHNRDFLNAFWACILGGFVPVPLAPSYERMDGAGSKLHSAWELLNARLVLTAGEAAARIRALCRSHNLPELRIQCVEELDTAGAGGAWHVGEPDELALLMLTSGSTGVPKGVMLSHGNLIRRSAGSAQMNGFSSDEVTLNWMPLDHVAGIVYFHLRDVFFGCQQIHAATDLVLQDPLIWLEWADRYRATITFAPNFAFGLVNDHAEEIPARAQTAAGAWELSCLGHVLNGAEAIVPRTARRFLQMLAPYGLPPSAMWPAWGMSETSSGTIYSDRFGLGSTRDDDPFVEVGRPIPGFSVRIVDDTDQVLVEGAIGSLQVKGGVVTTGYYNRPDLNAESFTADGWFRTGDLGLLNGGRLTITGREKDVIVINSVNYPCHEIEALVEEVDGVETSYTAACAVRDAGTNTDRLAIFFHPTAGCETVSAELPRTIRGTVSRRLGVSPDYLIPVEREAIPKTNIGKIQRTQLARSFAERKFADVIRRVEVLLGGANTLPDWFFRPVWRRAELRGRREIGPVLVFADSVGLGECLRQMAIAAGRECVVVSPGHEFACDDERITIDPGNGEHYRSAVEALGRRGFEPRTVVHLWTYREKPEELERAQDAGVQSVLRLVQALSALENAPEARLMVVSNASSSFENSALPGLLKTISQENSRLHCLHLELPPGADEENAALVLSEMGGQTHDAEVAYRGGLRWVRRLRRADLAAEPPGPMPIAKGGLYLLSGGLGGIGLELARYLLKRFHANLILVGRTRVEDAESSQRLDALRSLEALAVSSGGSVGYAAMDIGDFEGLHEVVRTAEERLGGTLGGVFHLAGIYHECPLTEETAAGMEEVLHPKLKGAWALHRLLAERPGAIFVSFSSVNGFLGGYGVGAYAAANAFLEGFSEYQRAFTPIKAWCVSWSLWDDVGMSRGYVMKEAAEGRGFCAISPRRGLSSLLAVLQRPPSHTLIGLDGSNLHVRRLADDLRVPAQSLAALVSAEASAIARLMRPAKSETGVMDGVMDTYGVPVRCQMKEAPGAVIDSAGRIDRMKASSLSRGGARTSGELVGPADELEKTIAGIWREVLRVEQFGVTDNFFDLGGSSLAMGQAARRLHAALKRKVSMTEMFQYPTVRTLAAYLSDSNKAGNAPVLAGSLSRGEQRRKLVRRRPG